MVETPMVLIEWNDCEHGEGWHSRLAIDEYCQRPLAAVSSIGWLLHKDDNWVVIAQSLGELDPEMASDLLKVPKSMIREMQMLTGPNGDKPDGENDSG